MLNLSDIGNRFLISGWTVCLAVFIMASGCSVTEPNVTVNTNSVANSAANAAAPIANAAPAPRGATIPIESNGPADTVRVFYQNLREKKFREAIFLTNLRPAVEGLTETELSDFALDFAALAGQIPAEIEINGEIVAGTNATVTANLPGKDDENEVQKIKLQRNGDVWIIQTVDDIAQKRIRKEGKQYFYNLRIETHQTEAKKMLERISKAQLANSLKNGGNFADMDTLVSSGLLPDDVKTSESTGYNYAISLTPDGRSYYATATPSVYGKSGRQSFIMKLDGKQIARVSGKDSGGRVLAN